jgi:hypothetical protein
MASNLFSGTFPNEIAAMNLTLGAIDFSDNKFNGTIPTILGIFPNMFYLSMHMNDMSGTIPTELGRLGML